MTTIQRQRIAEARAALDELEKEDPELDALPGSDMSDAEVDAFLERNREQIEESIREGKAELARGECFVLTDENTDQFIRDLMEKGSESRAGKS
jgi:hypothetical protein